jgi:hypothetical protein
MANRPTDPSLQYLNRGVLVTAVALVVASCVLGVFAFALWPLVGLRPLRSWTAPPLAGDVASGRRTAAA